MAAQLLSTENKQIEILVDNDLLILTDKRIILNDNFIGLNELRGAQVSSLPVTEDNLNEQRFKTLFATSAIVLSSLFSLYFVYRTHPYQFTDGLIEFAVGLLIGVPAGCVASYVIVIIAKIFANSTAKTVTMAKISITKIDNTFFLNKYYSLNNLKELQSFEERLNSYIYK